MPRKVYEQLTTRYVASAKKPGYHLDGQGLYLQVLPSGAKSWIYAYRMNGLDREIGLGSADDVSLARARGKAADARAQRADGVDPKDAKHAARKEAQVARLKAKTFKQCAEAFIDHKSKGKSGWKNVKHAAQWRSTLETYAYPKIGDLPVAKIDKGMVLAVLEPIWDTKTETANRVRGRIEKILDDAVFRDYRPEGPNPARWKGHLDKQLMKRSMVAPVQHHAALPHATAADYMTALRSQDGIGARALELIILTAARTNEVLGAQWPEVDLSEKLWVVPAERMKGKKEHRVPLSDDAVKLLKGMRKFREDGDYVFPGDRAGKPLSNMTCLAVLERMGREDITVHGFRSTFRDWAAEATAYPREVVEAALAHVNKDKVEAAYKRTDLFVKRRALMEDWARHCAKTESATVRDIRSAKKKATR